MTLETTPIRKAVAISPTPGWRNVELLKDCGLVPYLLHKNHNFCSVMVGAKEGDYPYLDTYVKGLQMEFLETGSIQEKVDYVVQNATSIDLLIFYGGYAKYSYFATPYKELNPNGKIYVALDANSHWMDRIQWADPLYTNLMTKANIIAASGHCLQQHLNTKWPWKIEYLPNGYYKFDHQHDVPCFEEKSNVILTVSRLGTEQKATDVLLTAFASIADQIPDWTLRLVGSVEERFQPWLKAFMTKHADLASRIQFTGTITDKAALYEEYRRAKIFALPSTFEGGTPNVVAEALHAGCAMAVTNFDEYEDAIDHGRCGLAAKMNNSAEYAQILYKLCNHPDLHQLSDNAYQYALRTYDMEFVVKRLYTLLFPEETI